MTGNSPDDSQSTAPDEWFTESYAREDVRVNFYDINGNVEAIPAFWMEGNVFSLDETPLRVNGVSIEDLVEVEWRKNEITPYFLRVKEKSTFRTFRVPLSRGDATNKRLKNFLETNTNSYRIDEDVLAFSIDKDDELLMEKMAWMRAEFDLWAEETDLADEQQSPT